MKIYKITNSITGNFYIGKTIRPLEKRFYHHKYGAIKHKNKSHLQLSMNKYGHDKFIIEEICSAFSEDELNALEIEYIQKLSPYYNKAPGGKGGRKGGFTLSEEHKNNISKAMSGRTLSEDHILKAAAGRSKEWKFIDPSGNILVLHNLAEFCRNNNLNQSHMVSVALRRNGFRSHKGYKAV